MNYAQIKQPLRFVYYKLKLRGADRKIIKHCNFTTVSS